MADKPDVAKKSVPRRVARVATLLVWVVTAIVAAVIIVSERDGWYAYNDGLRNHGIDLIDWLGRIGLIFACLTVWCYCSWVLVTPLPTAWRWIARGLALMLAVVTLCLPFDRQEPLYRTYTRGLACWARDHVDAPQIRKWAAELPVAIGRGDVIDEKLWPQYVRDLRPNYVERLSDGQGIFVNSGGGFQGWGVVVTAPDRPAPAELERDYVVTVAPGVYAWSQAE